jgi:hypothetical protein
MHDLGPILAAGQREASYTFRVSNPTDRTVRVLDLEHSCSCTSAEIDRRELGPGESARLVMTIAIGSQYAEKSIICAVVTDHPAYRSWEYEVRYTSCPRSRITPERIELASAPADGGDASPALLGSATLEVDSAGSADTDIRPTPSDVPPGLTVEIGGEPEVDRLKNGVIRSRYPLTIASDGVADGTFIRTLRVDVASGPPSTLIVSWTRDGPLACSPARLHFGAIDPDDPDGPPARRLLVRSTAGLPFSIERRDDDGRVVVRDSGHRAPLHTLEVALEPPDDPTSPALSGVLRFETILDDSGPTTIEVPWSAFVIRRDDGQAPRPSQAEPTTSTPGA